MKIIISLVVIFAGVASLYLAFHSIHQVWQSFWAGLASSLVVFGLSILAINFYLESASRRGAVRALFALSQETIANFHNELLELCWAEFGRDSFGNVLKEFKNANRDISALKKETRTKIYQIYSSSPKLREMTTALEGTLTELSRMVGWSLDHRLLAACLAARTSIASLNALPKDGSESTIDGTCKNLLMIDLTTGAARKILMRLAAIPEED